MLTIKRVAKLMEDPTELANMVKSDVRSNENVGEAVALLYYQNESGLENVIDTLHDGKTTSNDATKMVRTRIIRATKELFECGVIDSPMTLKFIKEGDKKVASIVVATPRAKKETTLLEDVAKACEKHETDMASLFAMMEAIIRPEPAATEEIPQVKAEPESSRATH